jgi:Asp/Glu/hydantoin racemase
MKIAFLHTLPAIAATFHKLALELFPAGVEILHVADEMLLKVVLAQGGLSPFIHRRVAGHVAAAEEAGASLVQVTCSSISPCVETSRPMVGIPVLKIDDPMVERALALGERIGVAATAPTTLKPTTELIWRKAQESGRTVQVDPLLAEGAYAAMFAGDQALHDRIVSEMILQLVSRNDVVLLAQASMARVLDGLDPAQVTRPVLTSPRLAVERARDVLAGLSPAGNTPAAG